MIRGGFLYDSDVCIQETTDLLGFFQQRENQFPLEITEDIVMRMLIPVLVGALLVASPAMAGDRWHGGGFHGNPGFHGGFRGGIERFDSRRVERFDNREGRRVGPGFLGGMGALGVMGGFGGYGMGGGQPYCQPWKGQLMYDADGNPECVQQQFQEEE
jgi:hypothetical protein